MSETEANKAKARTVIVYREKSVSFVGTLFLRPPLNLDQVSKIKALYTDYLQTFGNNERVRREQCRCWILDCFVCLPVLHEHSEEVKEKLERILNEG
jgi:hypothetical protein